MNENVFLGIDTSNYTTSIAVSSYDGKIINNIKFPLPVKLGERGLRQSDAVFARAGSGNAVRRLRDPDRRQDQSIKENFCYVDRDRWYQLGG